MLILAEELLHERGDLLDVILLLFLDEFLYHQGLVSNLLLQLLLSILDETQDLLLSEFLRK